MEALRQYVTATTELRPKDSTRLFVAIVKPHKPVVSCTIARWLWETLKLAGVDVSIFAAHSVRGAATSAAAGSGVQSQCSGTFTTNHLMTLLLGELFCLHLFHQVRPELFGRLCIVDISNMYSTSPDILATNNTIDM